MTPHFAPRSAYVSARLRSASPVQQRLVLLDGAINAVRATVHSLHARADHDSHVHAARARGLILELACSLRGDSMPELSGALNGLAAYMHRLLLRAIAERSAEPAVRVEQLLLSERDAWAARLRCPLDLTASAMESIASAGARPCANAVA